MLAQEFMSSSFCSEVCYTVGLGDSSIDVHQQSRDKLTMAVNGFDLELILLSVFGMNAPGLFRQITRFTSIVLPSLAAAGSPLRCISNDSAISYARSLEGRGV